MVGPYVVEPSGGLLWSPWQMPFRPRKLHPTQRQGPGNQLSYFHRALQDLRKELNALETEMDKVQKAAKRSDLQFVGDESSPEKLVFHYPVGRGVKPNEISVSIKDRRMTIEVKKERKSTDGSMRLYEECMQRFPLPKYVEVNDIQTSLTSDGYLRIEATVPKDRKGTVKSEMTPEGYLRVATPTKWFHEDEGGREIPVEIAPTTETSDEEKPSGCLPH